MAIDLSDLGAQKVDLSDLGASPADQDNRAPQSLDLNAKIPGTNISIPLVNSKIGKALQGGASNLDEAAADATVHGVESGTGGLAGKLLAFGKAAKDVVSGNESILPDQKSGAGGLALKYKEYKQQIKDAEDKMAQRSPVASGVGSATGLLATAPLIPELGGEQAIARLGQASPGLDAFLAGKSGGALSKIAGKAAGSAIEGAPLGAAQGIADGDEAKNPEDFIKGVASGTAMGSLGGAVIGGALKTTGVMSDAIPEMASKRDMTRKVGEAYNLGKAGQDFGTSSGKDVASDQLEKIPLEVTNSILAADKVNGEAVGKALDPQFNPNAANPINVDPTLVQASNDLFQTFAANPTLLQVVDSKTKNLVLQIGKLGNGAGDLSPVEARAIKDALYDLSDKMDGLNSDVSIISRKNALKIAGELDQTLKNQIPEYKDAAQKFEQFRSQVAEPFLEPNLPEDKRTKLLGDLKNKNTKLYLAVTKVFGTAMKPGEAALGSRSGLNKVLNNLDSIEASNPAAVQTLGGSASDVKSRWQSLADKMATLKQGQGFDPSDKPGVIGSIVGTGEGYTYGVANKAGQAANWVGQSAPVKLGSKLFGANNSVLSDLAQKMKTSNFKGSKIYGEALEKALNNKADAAKNAVLFKMLQDPDYRNWLKDNGYLDLTDNSPQSNQ